MTSVRAAALWILPLLGPPLAGPSLARAELRVLATSGMAASDGNGLEGFESPRLGPAGEVLFRSGTSALLRARPDGQITVLARTGAPLPAPLHGTFNGVGRGVGNRAGATAFSASLNSADGPCGIFMLEGDQPVLATLGERCAALAMNEQGDVLIERSRQLEVLAAGDGSLTTIGPAPDRIQSAALGDDGTVVLVSGTPLRARLVLGRPSMGLRDVVGVRDEVAGRRLRRMTAAALTPDGRIAFVGQVPVSGWVVYVTDRDAQTPPVPLATELEPYVGVAPDGSIVVRRRTKDRSTLIAIGPGTTTVVAEVPADADTVSPRIGAGGRVAWRQEGAIATRTGGDEVRIVLAQDVPPLGPGFNALPSTLADDGTMLLASRRDGLYVLHDGQMAPVLQPGMRLRGGPRVDRVGIGLRYIGDSIWADVQTGERSRLLRLREGQLETMLRSGAPVPGGGRAEDASLVRVQTLPGGRALLEVGLEHGRSPRSRGVVLAAGRGNQGLRRIVGFGDRIGGLTVQTARIGGHDGKDATVVATGPEGSALLRMHAGRFTLVVMTGRRAVGGGRYSSLWDVGGTPDRLLFDAFVKDRATEQEALFSWDPHTHAARREAAADAPAPGGGTFASQSVFAPISGLPWFTGRLSDETNGLRFIYAVGPGGPQRLLGPGTPVAGGTPLASILDVWPTPGGAVLFAEQGDPETRSVGLFLIRDGVVSPLFVTSSPTPVGRVSVNNALEQLDVTDDGIVFASPIQEGPVQAALFRIE